MSNPLVVFTEKWFSPKKKRLRQDYTAAQGLSNPWVVIFTQKSACGKLDSSNKACKILGGHFHPKKRLRQAGQQQRACQIQGVHFHNNNNKKEVASWLAATGLVKTQRGHFHRKKAPAAGLQRSRGLVRCRPKLRFGPQTIDLIRIGLRINSLA